ncbi:unnamed protein product [Prorocentrum cordatum]|uniref:Uncharacterized protein n=1 Tax=Prorocentrum cordatum TaxID=2364126 RepID=A0ABN9RM88_9DINO|nr:unnamed protein product [Polarella glacialis]
MELSGAIQLKLPPAADAMAPGSDVAQVLRAKIRSKCWSLLGAVSEHPRVGHPDIAEQILSFLLEPEALVPSEQGGWMHPSTGSANLDLFFQTVPQSSPQINHRLHELLAAAWGECPETCMRQVFMVGATREGKQDRYSFYDALLWLWDRQPASVLANLHLMPEVSYWKSLLELVARVCEGPRRSLERDVAQAEGLKKRTEPGAERGARRRFRPGSRLERAEEALKRYDSDPLYRTLLEKVARLFAEQLREDLETMKAGGRVGLRAKWCPSLYHSFDQRTLICESIARWLFPPTLRQLEHASEREYAHRARGMLRGALGELREYTKSPERLMCQHRWPEINCQAVPALCMRNNADRFAEHDGPRFQVHLDKLTSGKVKANVGALLPHELLVESRASDPKLPAELNQAQWESLVARVRGSGALAGCVAACDVSGSMQCQAGRDSTCMDVAVALPLLLVEVTERPCARKLTTFHEDPSIITLPAARNLAKLDRFARRMPWGGSTNFCKVFDLLLRMDPPPKRVFVFSDMQFSQAAKGGTDLQTARELFRRAGKPLPEVAFWNLVGKRGAPATAGEQGVALVSGFSAGMLRVLLLEGGPQTVLEGLGVLAKALGRPLLRRPRVVFTEAEAVDVFRCPRQAAPERWAVARALAGAGLADAPMP